jgi:hypothetical protein
VLLDFLKSLGAGLFLGGILFLAAGRLDWPLAWVYTGIVVLDGLLLRLTLEPDLMRERSRPGLGAKSWDRVLARRTGPLGSTLILVTAGLQVRFQGLHVLPLALQLGGLGAFVLGMGLITWAMAADNDIQKSRDGVPACRILLTVGEPGASSHQLAGAPCRRGCQDWLRVEDGGPLCHAPS